MNNVEEKRKKILDYLNKKAPSRELVKFQFFVGPGLLKRIKRFFLIPIFYPNFYFSYLFGFKLLYFFYSKIPFLKRNNYKTKFFNNRILILPLNNMMCVQISFLNYIPEINEIKLTKFLVKNFKESDIFYDIGANYGFYTYLALEFCKEVHSFEPLLEVFHYLKLNLENEPRAFLNNFALYNENGEVVIYKSKYGLGGSTIIGDVYKENKNSFLNNAEKVKTITLDDYFKNHTPPTIMKIDVEGAEYLVLEGGKNLLKNYNPIIAMEIWQDSKNHKQAIELLKNFGYQAYEIDFDGEIKLTSNEILLKGGNFIFIKK